MTSDPIELSKEPEAFGPYLLISELARSETHRVVVAASPNLDTWRQLCVIKLVNPEISERPGFEDAFAEAARRLIHLDHRNVAQVFDAGQVGERFYLAQEYVLGCSLRELLDASEATPEPVPLDLALLVLVDLLRGIYHALRQPGPDEVRLQLWHGSLSARHVLISDQGEIKLIGFDREWRPSGVISASSAEADTLLVEDDPGPRDDVKAIGELMARLLGERGDGLDPGLIGLMEDARAADPAERPRDAGMLLRPLRAALHHVNPRCGPPQLQTYIHRVAHELLDERRARELELLERLSASRDRARPEVPRRKTRTLVMEEDAPVVARARDRAVGGADELIGQLPGTRYKILRTLGEGGMGTVYAAEHTDLEKVFALKILHETNRPREKMVDKLRREARAASKLGHPNIVAVTDFGETPDGRVFFAMEHLEGQSLGELLDAESPLDQLRVIDILRQVCEGLAAAHNKGLVHRDIKPDNIFLVPAPRGDLIKLLDFGVAVSSEQEQSRSKNVAGTPSYMSPELVRRLPVDGRSDLYSLGVVAYEALSGFKPFGPGAVMEVLRQHLREEPPPLRGRESAKHVHPALESVVMRALSKDPDERPPSAEAMIELLEAARGSILAEAERDRSSLESERIQHEIEEIWADAYARHTGEHEEISLLPRGRRRWILTSLAAAAVIGAVAFAGYFFTSDTNRGEGRGPRSSVVTEAGPEPVTPAGSGQVDAATVPGDAGSEAGSNDGATSDGGPLADAEGEAGVAEAGPRQPDAGGQQRHESRSSRARRHVRLGQELLARGDLARAEAEFSRALAIDSRRHEAIAGLGKVAFQRSDYARAEELARRALERDPRNVRYRLDLGAALYRRGRTRAAETLFRQILHDHPNNRAAQRYLDAVTRDR